MKKILLQFIAFVAGLLAIASCSSQMPEYDDGYVDVHDEITTYLPINIVMSSATLKGSTYSSGDAVTERGFYFSTDTIHVNSIVTDEEIVVYKAEDTADGIYTVTVDDLVLGQEYFVMAYARKSSGVLIYGSQKTFFPDALPVGTADAPVASAVSDTYKTAVVEITLDGFGKDNLIGEDATMLKPYDIGAYIYKSTETIAQAEKISIGEGLAQTNAIREESMVSVIANNLKGNTEYKVVPYLVMGLYRNYDENGVYLMDEVNGEVVSFKTLPTPPPAISIAQADNVTTYSVVLNATVTSDSDDSSPQVGFYIGKSEDGLISEENRYEVSVNMMESADITKVITTLSSDTEYYVKAYINANSQTSYSELITFKTLFLARPVINMTDMNYTYRLENVTSGSARIQLRITDGMDPSLTEYGVKWGTSSDDLSNVSNGVSIDQGTGMFTIDINGLDPGKVYHVSPFARNGAGDVESPEIISFSTPVSKMEYLYDASVSAKAQMYERMSNSLADCQDLIYYELDPIAGASATYYLLDRNIGARSPYLYADIGLRVSNNEPTEELRQRVGAYYQWNKDVPSVTWQMQAAANLTKAPNNFSWVKGTAVNGLEWSVNPCPEGYDIPTMSQWKEMVDAVKGEDSFASMQTIFNKMMLGPTAYVGANNGGRNNNGTYDSALWTKDVSAETDAVEVFMVYPSKESTVAGTKTIPRTSCAPIRCVRVVNK